MDATSGVPSHYGVFRVGALQLALPLAALREVVPLDRLEQVAFSDDRILGAIARRGLFVPVLDVSKATGIATGACEGTCVVIAGCEGRLIGLLADSTEGVFECPPNAMSVMDGHPVQRTLLVGAFQRPDDRSVVSVISTCAIFDLEGVPTVADHVSETRSSGGTGDGTAAAKDDRSELVLVSCDGLPFGVRSQAVHATVIDPQVVPSPLSAGHFEGFMEYHGTDVPVVDLRAFCGFGPVDRTRARQAILVGYPDGLVAFTVTLIVDVVSANVGETIALPPRTVGRPDLFAGALPAAALPGHVSLVAGALGYLFLLDSRAILEDPDLAGLARLNVPARTSTGPRDLPAVSNRLATERTTLLTYSLGSEVATPMAQVLEILPWSDDFAVLNRQDTAIGLIVSRGRAIPVFDLANLIEYEPQVAVRRESVLVLAARNQYVGLLVSHLMNIDHAPAAKVAGALAADTRLRVTARDLGTGFPNITVGSDEAARLLPIIDLARIAAELDGTPAPARPERSAAPSAGGASPRDAAGVGAAVAAPFVRLATAALV